MTERHASYRLSARPLVAVMSAVLGVLLVLLGAVWFIYTRYPEPRPALPWSGPRGTGAESLQRQQQAQREHLRAFGWVDRERGVAHIPIEAAYELMLAEAAARADAPQAGQDSQATQAGRGEP